MIALLIQFAALLAALALAVAQHRLPHRWSRRASYLGLVLIGVSILAGALS